MRTYFSFARDLEPMYLVYNGGGGQHKYWIRASILVRHQVGIASDSKVAHDEGSITIKGLILVPTPPIFMSMPMLEDFLV